MTINRIIFDIRRRAGVAKYSGLERQPWPCPHDLCVVDPRDNAIVCLRCQHQLPNSHGA